MRWFLAALAAAAGAAAVVTGLVLERGGGERSYVLPQDPMPGRLLVGFQDDASFRWAADRARMLDDARDADAVVIRTTLVWAHVAPRRPADATSSFDPAYRFESWTTSRAMHSSAESSS